MFFLFKNSFGQFLYHNHGIFILICNSFNEHFHFTVYLIMLHVFYTDIRMKSLYFYLKQDTLNFE